MSWKQLLAQRKVQLHTTSKQELDGLRALIERDLTDAALAGLSADRRFATAYNAALQTAKMVIACAGYRVASTPGHHRLHFEAARIALGSSADRFLDYFETSRRKRNVIDYDYALVATETEAEEILTEAKVFNAFVEQCNSDANRGNQDGPEERTCYGPFVQAPVDYTLSSDGRHLA
jgi:uncharacterized protein (UPF0332 family)